MIILSALVGVIILLFMLNRIYSGHPGEMGGFIVSVITATVTLIGLIIFGAPWWALIIGPTLGVLIGTYIILPLMF